MTRTMQKNGTRVEQAADRLALAGEGQNWLRVTISAIAKESGMSKPTVQKYMNMLVAHGAYIEEKRDMRYCTKNTPITYRFAKTIIQAGG